MYHRKFSSKFKSIPKLTNSTFKQKKKENSPLNIGTIVKQIREAKLTSKEHPIEWIQSPAYKLVYYLHNLKVNFFIIPFAGYTIIKIKILRFK